MHLSTILEILLAASATAAPQAEPGKSHIIALQKRGCYTGGEPWEPREELAYLHASSLCNNQMGQRNYAKDGIRTACKNLGPDKSALFVVGNLSGGGRYIDHDECYDGLQKEIHGCLHGGNTAYANWYYRSDPQSGQCGVNGMQADVVVDSIGNVGA